MKNEKIKTEEHEIQKEIYFNDKDWFLQNFVIEANTSTPAIQITLNLKGIIISGDLIGGPEYFTLFAKRVKSIEGQEDKEKEIQDQYEKLGEIYKDEDKNQNPSYIHLKDAQIFVPGQYPLPKNEGVLWRGKINSVDAFFIGRLNV